MFESCWAHTLFNPLITNGFYESAVKRGPERTTGFMASDRFSSSAIPSRAEIPSQCQPGHHRRYECAWKSVQGSATYCLTDPHAKTLRPRQFIYVLRDRGEPVTQHLAEGAERLLP